MSADEGSHPRAFVAAPAGDEVAVHRPDTDAVAAALLDDVDDVVVYPEVAGGGHVGPFLDELAFVGEQLHAVVLAVGDIDAAVLVDPDIVEQGELAGAGSLPAPGLDQLAVRAELVDAMPAVAVGHEQAAVGRDGEAGGHVEGQPLERRGRRELLAERPQRFAARRVLGGDVEVAVDEPDVVVGRDVDAVRVGGERPLAPRADEVAVGAPDGEGVQPAAENVNFVLGVDRPVGRRAKRPVLGHVGPLRDALVPEISGSYDCHAGVSFRLWAWGDCSRFGGRLGARLSGKSQRFAEN